MNRVVNKIAKEKCWLSLPIELPTFPSVAATVEHFRTQEKRRHNDATEEGGGRNNGETTRLRAQRMSNGIQNGDHEVNCFKLNFLHH